MTDWFAEVNAARPSVVDVASALGITARGRRLTLCPACGKEERHHGPVAIQDVVWRCHSCNVGGSAVHLAAFVITGQRKPAEWGPVRAFFASNGWCSAYRSAVPYTPPTPKPREVLPYPERLADFWAATGPVAADEGTAEYWAVRSFGPHQGAARALLRAPGVEWWPHHGRWRLVVPAYDAAGVVRSVHARAISDTDMGKTRWPKGRNAERLLFADPWLGVWLLRGESIPERVIVLEGATDYLHVSSLRPPGVAVLGAAAGGFAALADVRWPKGCVVYAGTDDDATGDKYAAVIRAAVPSAVEVRRIRWGIKDASDYLCGGGQLSTAMGSAVTM